MSHGARAAAAVTPPDSTKVAVVASAAATADTASAAESSLSAKDRDAVEAVRTALDALMKDVPEQSHPDALKRAFQAYYAYRAENPETVKKPYLYFVDYGLDSRKPRGYVFDMQALTVVDGPFTVAHGRGSSDSRLGVPTRFSNRNGSAATSLGLFLAQETYNFTGKSGGQRYSSIGLRLQGLSGAFNSAARSRGVVVHGAPYVTQLLAGRSEGCPAMEQSRAKTLIPKIANGGLVYLFSPRDSQWMEKEPWAQRLVSAMTGGVLKG
jgi:hypothetical protein